MKEVPLGMRGLEGEEGRLTRTVNCRGQGQRLEGETGQTREEEEKMKEKENCPPCDASQQLKNGYHRDDSSELLGS